MSNWSVVVFTLAAISVGFAHAFSYSNCGLPSDGTRIDSLTVSPSPIVLGSNITISGSVTLNETLSSTSEFSVELDLQHEIFGVWVPVPCINNVGSCNYKSLCDLIHNCPLWLHDYNIPCPCPLDAGTYTIPAPGKSFHIGSGSSLYDGNYKATATVYNSAMDRLICVSVAATISSTSDNGKVITFVDY
jgi:ganglioside GM2 activator